MEEAGSVADRVAMDPRAGAPHPSSMKYLMIAALLAVGPASFSACKAGGPCCRVCHKGKACGNSCIAANKTCHQTGGCACNG